MKNLFIFTLLFITTTSYSQAILVFKPNTCIMTEQQNDHVVKHESAFGFDFKSKVLYYSDDFTDWSEKIVSDTIINQYEEYKTIEFYTETSRFVLFLYPNENSLTPRPQQLLEYPFGGQVDTRQYYFSKLNKR